jgi:hypothetical protein
LLNILLERKLKKLREEEERKKQAELDGEILPDVEAV